MSNYSTTLFDLDESISSFSLLNGTIEPKHASTPKKPRPQHVDSHRPLRIINVNCQSLRNKKERFLNLVRSTRPDIIIATETWLNPAIYSSEFFGSSLTIFRRDRITNTTGGGILIAINSCFKSEEYILPMCTNIELIWVRLSTKENKHLYIGACYRPEKKDEATLNACDSYLQKLTRSEKNAILIGGDFNLDGWDWVNNVVKPRTRYVANHHLFRDMLKNHGLTQIVNEPTRKGNILDLLITNRPNQINRTEILPGIATGEDHHVVYTELDRNPHRTKQRPKNIFVYQKANWPGFKQYVETLASKMSRMDEESTVEEIWNTVKIGLLDGMKKFIPQRMTKTKECCPWIDKNLQKLIKRRNTAFQASKKTGKHYYEQKFLGLKRKVQLELRRAYWKHNEDIVSPSEKDVNNFSCMKRFWRFIKHQKKDYTSITTLN